MYGSDADKGPSRLSKAIALVILLVAVLSLFVGSGCAGALPQPAGPADTGAAATDSTAEALRAEAEATIAAAQSTIEAAETSATPEPAVAPTPATLASITTPAPTVQPISTPQPLPSPSPAPEPTTVHVSPWAMERGNAQRSAWTADVGPESPGLLWTFQAEGDLSDPVVASDGTIYVDAKDGTLYALDASGVEKWRLAIAGESWAPPVLASDGTVYIARGSDVHAVGPDGARRWTLSAEQQVSDVVVGGDGTIYVSSDCLHAVAPDGQRRWVTSSEGCRGLGSLAVAPEGRIYGLSATSLFAFDANGTLLWEQMTAPGARGGSTALTIGPQGDIYVNGITAASVSVALPIAPLDVLSPWGNYRFDSFRGEGFDGYIPAAPAIAPDGTVYLTWRSVGDSYYTADNVLTADVGPWHLQARTPAAVTLWSVALGGEPCSQPVVGGDGTAYVALCDGDLLAVRADGTLQWRFAIGESQDRGYWGAWRLALRTGVIVVSSGNRLQAIGEAAPPLSPPTIPTPAPTACTQEPEEAKIAYVGPDNNIWLMNSDGSGKKRIVTDARAFGELTWSPDGSRIAFVQDCRLPGRLSSCYHIVVANADGTDRLDLTPSDSGKGYSPLDSFVDWSPDGSKIAYSKPGEIYLVSTDASNGEFLMEGIMPDWSPDGTKIAYVKAGTGIYVANADGSNPVRLTEGYECDPDWSPDGERIAYTSGELTYIMNSDGSHKVLLVEDGDNPRWSPDGTQIAFDREWEWGVYVINADGSNLKRIADGAWPAWQPNPCISGFPASTPTPMTTLASPKPPAIEWSRTFGGPKNDIAVSAQQTSDGGYIMVGWTDSYGAGDEDIWLVKTNAQGNKVWDRTFGGLDTDRGHQVQQTADGGYIMVGWTVSYGTGGPDVWLIKTDAQGDKEWIGSSEAGVVIMATGSSRPLMGDMS